MGPDERRGLRAEARRQLWRQGDLRYLLDRNQLADYESIWSKPGEDYVLDVSRQTGKSYLCCVMAAEYGLKHPGAQIKYASLTQKSIGEIVEPILDQILQDCPEDLRPKFDRQTNVWRFPNGSRMTAAGTDNKHYTALRGPRAHLIIKDEAGFFSDPEEVDAVLSPQRMTTGGIIIEASTPPITPDHPFTTRAASAKAAGRYSHRTIWDHARMTQDEIRAFLEKEAKLRGLSFEEFKGTSVYKREFLATHVIDESRAVVPEWHSRSEALVAAVPRPRWFYPCEGFDLGFRDGMGVVFGYWDFKRAAAIIEDEVLVFGTKAMDQSALGRVASEIRAKEKELWGISHIPPPFVECKREPHGAWSVFGRWADNDLLAINELAANYGVHFQPTRKDDKELQVNELRRLVASGKLLIHPRCKRLQAQLATTIWNKQRTSYERTHDGHGDLLDALVYFLRNLPRQLDPAPAFWDKDEATHFLPEEKPSGEARELINAFRDN